MRFWIYILPFLIIPSFAGAEVRISEVAWMGTEVSTSDEWIELYNDATAPVDLTNWTLSATDGTPDITLEGTIAAGGYYLLERTDDDSALGVSADSLYSGVLSNSGEVMRLSDASGVLRDEVIGGEGWENIGGDNVTKETPQYSSGQWLTGVATPRAANITYQVLDEEETPVPEDTQEVVEDASTESATAPGSGPMYPLNNISVEILGPSRVYVDGPAEFSADGTDTYDKPLKYFATYKWNFGDGNTAVGENVVHSYRRAGQYMVVLETFYGGFVASEQMIIEVVPTEIVIESVETSPQSVVELTNSAHKPKDISLWVIRSSGEHFNIPKNTIILPGGHLAFFEESTGLFISKNSPIDLLYPNGQIAYSYDAHVTHELNVVPVAASISGAAVPISPKVVSQPRAVTPVTSPPLQGLEDGESAGVQPAAQDLLSAAVGGVSKQGGQGNTQSTPAEGKWILATVVLIGVAVIGFLFVGRNEADQYVIVDEDEEE